MRQAPEVSSTPHRIKKDLEQARRIAELLEEEYLKLRSMKPGPEPSLEVKKEGGDPTMATENAGDNEHPAASENPANGVEEENLEPLEKGSQAVERRVEKLMAESDISLEGEELEMKKVSRAGILCMSCFLGDNVVSHRVGPLPRLLACGVQCMLLLCGSVRSFRRAPSQMPPACTKAVVRGFQGKGESCYRWG